MKVTKKKIAKLNRSFEDASKITREFLSYKTHFDTFLTKNVSLWSVNLKIIKVIVLILFFSITPSTCLRAIGRQRSLKCYVKDVRQAQRMPSCVATAREFSAKVIIFWFTSDHTRIMPSATMMSSGLGQVYR